MTTNAGTKQPLPQFVPDDPKNRRQIADWMREIHQGNFPSDINTSGRISASAGSVGILSVSTLVANTMTVTNNFGVDGNLSVSGSTILNGPTLISNTLTVSGQTAVVGPVHFYQTLTVDTNLVVNAGTLLNGTLTVSAHATFQTGALVKGTLSASGGVAVTGDVTGTGVGLFANARSRTGSQTAANAVPATVFTFPSVAEVALWLITVNIGSQGDVNNYAACAVIITDAATAKFIVNAPGALMSLSLTGLALNGTQGSGITQTLKMSSLKIL